MTDKSQINDGRRENLQDGVVHMEDMKMIQLNEQEELAMHTDDHIKPTKEFVSPRSEERRVGKECL